MRFSLFNFHANRVNVGIQIATFGHKHIFYHSLLAIVWTSCDGWWIDVAWFALNVCDGEIMVYAPNGNRL